VVLSNNMRIIIKICFVSALIFCFSCEDQKCPDCTSEEPLQANLEVELDRVNPGHETIINVYEGNLDDSILYRTVKTAGTHATIYVNLNKKYTLTATYYIPDSYYVAIDSATPRVKYEKTECDDPCYYVYDKNIDLRLKYSK